MASGEDVEGNGFAGGIRSAAGKVADQARERPLTAAAIVGGAAAAGAGAWLGARALARRNEAAAGKPINAVMETAITASECAGAAKNGG